MSLTSTSSPEAKDDIEESISWSMDKAIDAAIMLSSDVMKSHEGEPHYPADEPGDFGTNGSMTTPTSGEVSGKSKPGKNRGPYPYATTGEVASKSRPKGWNKKSSGKYWSSVSKGPHGECIKHVGGNVDDPHAFCAWAEHEATGHWPAERRGKKTEKQVMPSTSMPSNPTMPSTVSLSQKTSVSQFRGGLSVGQRSL